MGVEQTTQNHTPGSAGGADVDAIGFFLDENLRPGRFAVYESDLEAKKMMMMMMEKLGAEECESAEWNCVCILLLLKNVDRLLEIRWEKAA